MDGPLQQLEGAMLQKAKIVFTFFYFEVGKDISVSTSGKIKNERS